MKQYRRGFILIELLVVLLIIALIIAIVMPFYSSAVKDAKIHEETENTRTVVVALQATLTIAYEEDSTKKYINCNDMKNVKLSKVGLKTVEHLIGEDIGVVSHITIGEKNVLETFSYKTPNGSLMVYDHGDIFVRDLYG